MDLGPARDLAVEALERVGRVQLRAMRGREGHIGQDTGLRRVEQAGEPRQLRPQLVDDLAPLGPGGIDQAEKADKGR